MSSVKDRLRRSGYSDKAIELYLNKVNVGRCDEANICCGYTGPCGDTMEFFLQIAGERIRDANFQALGCEGAFICGSALTEPIKGKTLTQAEGVEPEQLIDYLEKIPEDKYDCVCLSLRTLSHTLKEFKKRQRALDVLSPSSEKSGNTIIDKGGEQPDAVI
jgi:NifU-like protein involved in Fe-S cluster formation